MSGTQVMNGKALEWRVAQELSKATGFPIVRDESAENAEKCYLEVIKNQMLLLRYEKWVPKSVNHILQKENHRLSTPGSISISPDSRGMGGDVRDVVVGCHKFNFGISCKNNHKAYKHSRLSPQIDFVRKWELAEEGCSQSYYSSVNPIFDRLENICTGDKERGRRTLWSEMGADFIAEVYSTLISGFKSELLNVRSRSSLHEKNMAAAFAKYVIGQHDFYKLIVSESNSVIEAYNLCGTLSVAQMRLPDRLIDVATSGNNTLLVTLNHGYSFTMRIHNASSKIERSLKFDIQADGTPSGLYRHVFSV